MESFFSYRESMKALKAAMSRSGTTISATVKYEM